MREPIPIDAEPDGPRSRPGPAGGRPRGPAGGEDAASPIRRATPPLLGLVTALLMLVPLWRAGDGLSAAGDDYSEAGAVRAAERFAREGFGKTAGLPDVGYGERFPLVGLRLPSGIRADDAVYHGDPPGVYWGLGLLMTLGGPDRLAAYRYVSVGLALLACGVLVAALARTLGAGRAAFVYVACLGAPMFTSMAHGLYNHGPTLSLLLVEIAILARMFGRGAARPWELVGLGVLGLLQGWLSYHYAGLVAFAPVPIALLLTPPGRPVPWRSVLAAVVVAGAGFVLAHVFHFGQSVLYFGSVAEAVAEYRFRSGKQYELAGTALAAGPRGLLVLHGIGLSARVYGRWTHLLAPMSILVSAAWLASLLVTDMAGTILGRWRFAARSSAGSRQILAIVAAIAIVELWVVLMPYHAINHMPFTGRQFFLVYLATALSIATTVRVEVARIGEGPGGPAPG